MPEIKASATAVAGMENRIQVTWAMENASSDAQVTMMLTDSADQWVGEVIQSGLPSSGSKAIDLPTTILPGTYHLSVVSETADKAPIYAIADATFEVTAPISLSTPGQPEVLSTGNGEISLHFASIAGNVTAYRIWVSDSTSGKGAVPIMDITPQSGSEQNAVITGLPAGATYEISVSAIGNEQGRVVLSPTSASAPTILPVPQPPTLAVALDAGSQPVIEQTYPSYDGNEEKLLLTTAEQASLKVTSDQEAAITLSVNGQPLGSSEHVSAGELPRLFCKICFNLLY